MSGRSSRPPVWHPCLPDLRCLGGPAGCPIAPAIAGPGRPGSTSGPAPAGGMSEPL